ncbi:alcohol dehydrogenase catalytic domain-containing protein [Paenarthrobacter sp. AT5]|uniref:alcohol dehydrogenase catalytic domain-containing protein n=1 Tax=Paenarthrobacter TaxID=1742992 RepID=UPI0029343320|nr:alcohol dehydrogenase catalytic domain-containing protein [Paenarthrobacter sp. AT5]WOC62722.1 alcohol dehydrogenase catalytic domain-containing protein [Paenarthrobacter sp. AT5]
MTLGHEGAGIVDKLRDRVVGVQFGDSVAVYGPWGCGNCYACSQGKESYCLQAADPGIAPPGLRPWRHRRVNDRRQCPPPGAPRGP